MALFSFDLESEYDKSEMNNVVDQAQREIANRYDFKNTTAQLSWKNDDKQALLINGFENEDIGQIETPLLHYAYDDLQSWEERHHRYACWEAGMNAKGAWPVDPRPVRQLLKKVFRNVPFRGAAAFVHCYIVKLGFLDGTAGYRFARSRARYYQMILDASKEKVQPCAESKEQLGHL